MEAALTLSIDARESAASFRGCSLEFTLLRCTDVHAPQGLGLRYCRYGTRVTWGQVKCARATLGTLLFRYPDRAVHKFAVDCLEDCLDDDKLTLYMMPLIQVLRYEAFLDNDLTQFLLRRALKNKRIGHQMFWLLRAELAVAPMGATTRFTLILEAYCRGEL